MKHCFVTTLAALLLTATYACHDNQPTETANTPADTIAINYYNYRSNGNFKAYVDAMLSCDNMPADYKARMIAMLKHHYQSMIQEKKGVSQVKVSKTEMHDKGKMANVYLNVTYNDHSHEEVMLPLVLDKGVWRIR